MAMPDPEISMTICQRCYQDQGVRDQDQDQTGRDRDRDQDQGGRDQDQDQQGRDQDQDQDLKKVVFIGLETKTRSRDPHPWLPGVQIRLLFVT